MSSCDAGNTVMGVSTSTPLFKPMAPSFTMITSSSYRLTQRPKIYLVVSSVARISRSLLARLWRVMVTWAQEPSWTKQ